MLISGLGRWTTVIGINESAAVDERAYEPRSQYAVKTPHRLVDVARSQGRVRQDRAGGDVCARADFDDGGTRENGKGKKKWHRWQVTEAAKAFMPIRI